MRACSYHASPGVCQASVLWTDLWIILVNTLVNQCTAADDRGCGKVDNRPGQGVLPGRGLSASTVGAKYPQADP